MELELNLTHLNGYDTILDDTVYQEETMEAIVPDAYPDIARIVDTEGAIFLTGKEVKEGRAELSGVVKATVIYLPDGTKGLRHMEVTIPFKTNVDRGDIRPPCKLVASPRTWSADTRSLNPRKILVRVNFCVGVRMFHPKTANISSGTENAEEHGIQQLITTQNAYMVTAVQEKNFTFSDDVNISGSRPAAEELLKSRAELMCNESKLIGNKLIFKGEVNLQLMYRAADDNMYSSLFELPFSQIMEVAGVEENADNSVDIHFTDVNCAIAGGEDNRTISVNMGMLAQGVVREMRKVNMLSDIYSTNYELKPEMETVNLQELAANGNERQTVREQMETEAPVQSVADVNVNIGQLRQSREGETVRLSAEAEITVVYMAEDGSPHTVVRRVTSDCDLMLPEDSICTFDCNSVGERFAVPSAGGLELRFPIDFRYLALSPKKVAAVSNVSLDENVVKDHSNQPSVILRMVDQESLWDIAKVYATTTGDIMRANGLTEEYLPRGRLLLIPKKR